jgi:hypothetical protein
MSGFWVGFNEAWDKDLERKFIAREKEKEAERRRKEALLGERLSALTSRRSNRVQTADELNSYRNRMSAYGFNDTIIDSVLATGDTKNIGSFLGSIDQQYTIAEQAGRGQQFLETIETTIENAVITPEGTQTISGDALQEYLGVSLEEFGLEDTSFDVTVPGGFGYVPPVYTEERDIKEYGEMEKRIADNAYQTASNELRRLKEQSTAITRHLESGSLDENEEKILKEDQQTLLTRIEQVGTALESYSGEEKDALPLLVLFGTDAVEKISGDFARFDTSKLLPVFQETIGKAPIPVTSREQAIRLAQLGVLKEGDFILVVGEDTPIKIQYGEE